MYRDLIVWKRAFQFTLDIYAVTKTFPREELFGLTSQMRRAAASIPANIAEGSMRSNKENLHFLQIARGSMAESEVWLELSHKLNYIDDATYKGLYNLCDEIGRLLSGLVKSL
ncbi:MAG: four helix bundle protein [Candidatus Zixiibacteriota bacterium]|nr:MAG: four helix bundle protein [candidate division Zixibacteria bacterium]